MHRAGKSPPAAEDARRKRGGEELKQPKRNVE
jgi:hypothetical protein